MKGNVIDRIPVENIIISVFDKTGLDYFTPEMLKFNRNLKIISTGGTHTKLKEILGDNPLLLDISQITGVPEMEGGLVKTLHPKIHAGILGERNNPAHQDFIRRKICGFYIDMVVVNLYPFDKVVSEPAVTFEKARGNIDIGGPTMLRGAAKNFMSCAAVCDPNDYDLVLNDLRNTVGSTTFDLRLSLAKKVFNLISEYDASIFKFIKNKNFKDIRKGYKFSNENAN